MLSVWWCVCGQNWCILEPEPVSIFDREIQSSNKPLFLEVVIIKCIFDYPDPGCSPAFAPSQLRLLFLVLSLVFLMIPLRSRSTEPAVNAVADLQSSAKNENLRTRTSFFGSRTEDASQGFWHTFWLFLYLHYLCIKLKYPNMSVIW